MDSNKSSEGVGEKEDVDHLMSQITELINSDLDCGEKSAEPANISQEENNTNSQDLLTVGALLAVNEGYCTQLEDSENLKKTESEVEHGKRRASRSDRAMSMEHDENHSQNTPGYVKLIPKGLIKQSESQSPAAASSGHELPDFMPGKRPEDIPSCSKADSPVSGMSNIDIVGKQPVVLLTKLAPGVTSIKVKADTKTHSKSVGKPLKSSSGLSRKPPRKVDAKKSAWYDDDDASLSDISVSDISMSDSEELGVNSKQYEKTKSKEGGTCLREERKQKVEAGSDIMEALQSDSKESKKGMSASEVNTTARKNSISDHKIDIKGDAHKGKRKSVRKTVSGEMKYDAKVPSGGAKKNEMNKDSMMEEECKSDSYVASQTKADSEMTSDSEIEGASSIKQETTSSEVSLHGQVGKQSKAETHSRSISPDSAVASKKNESEDMTGKTKGRSSHHDTTSHKSKSARKDNHRSSKRYREPSESDGIKQKKSREETLDMIIPKPEPVKETGIYCNDIRYQLSLNSVSLSDLSNESFRKFVNLALDCAVHFRRKPMEFGHSNGHVDLFFGDFLTLQSAMQRLGQLPVLADGTWVRGAIRCFQLPQVGQPIPKNLWKNTVSAKLYFEFCAGKSQKLQQLAAYRDRKKEGTKRKSAQLHRIPASISQEMLTLLFPFSLGVKISDTDPLDKGLKGPVEVEFESAEWMEAVLTCFREFAVLPKAMQQKSFHLLIKNYSPPKDKSTEKQFPPAAGPSKSRYEMQQRAGVTRGPQGSPSSGRDQLKNRALGPFINRNQDQSQERRSKERFDQRKRPHPVANQGRSPEKRRRFDEAGQGHSGQRGLADSPVRNWNRDEQQSQQSTNPDKDTVREIALARGLDPNNPDVLKILEMSAHLETLQMLVKHQTAQASSLGITGLPAQQAMAMNVSQERQRLLAMDQTRDAMDAVRMQASQQGHGMRNPGRLLHPSQGGNVWQRQEEERRREESRRQEEERREESRRQEEIRRVELRRQEEERREETRRQEEIRRVESRRQEEERRREETRRQVEERRREETRRQEEEMKNREQERKREEGLRRREVGGMRNERWTPEYERRKNEEEGRMHEKYKIDQAERIVKENIASKLKQLGDLKGIMRHGNRNSSPNLKGSLRDPNQMSEQSFGLEGSLSDRIQEIGRATFCMPQDREGPALGGPKRDSPRMGSMNRAFKRDRPGNFNAELEQGPVNVGSPRRGGTISETVPEEPKSLNRRGKKKDNQQRGPPHMGMQRRDDQFSYGSQTKQSPSRGRPQRNQSKPGRLLSVGRGVVPTARIDRAGNIVPIPIQGRTGQNADNETLTASSNKNRQEKGGITSGRPAGRGHGNRGFNKKTPRQNSGLLSPPRPIGQAERGSLQPGLQRGGIHGGGHQRENLEASRERPGGREKQGQPGEIARGRGRGMRRGGLAQGGVFRNRFEVAEEFDMLDPNAEEFLHNVPEVDVHMRGRLRGAPRGQGHPRGRGERPPYHANTAFTAEWHEREEQSYVEEAHSYRPDEVDQPEHYPPEEDYGYIENQNYPGHAPPGHLEPQHPEDPREHFQEQFEEYVPDDISQRKPWLNREVSGSHLSSRGWPRPRGRGALPRGGRVPGFPELLGEHHSLLENPTEGGWPREHQGYSSRFEQQEQLKAANFEEGNEPEWLDVHGVPWEQEARGRGHPRPRLQRGRGAGGDVGIVMAGTNDDMRARGGRGLVRGGQGNRGGRGNRGQGKNVRGRGGRVGLNAPAPPFPGKREGGRPAAGQGDGLLPTPAQANQFQEEREKEQYCEEPQLEFEYSPPVTYSNPRKREGGRPAAGQGDGLLPTPAQANQFQEEREQEQYCEEPQLEFEYSPPVTYSNPRKREGGRPAAGQGDGLLPTPAQANQFQEEREQEQYCEEPQTEFDFSPPATYNNPPVHHQYDGQSQGRRDRGHATRALRRPPRRPRNLGRGGINFY